MHRAHAAGGGPDAVSPGAPKAAGAPIVRGARVALTLGFEIAVLLVLLSSRASAGDRRYGFRIGLRTGYAFSQSICAECAHEDHPEGWLEGVDFGFEIGERWQVRTQALVTALDEQIFHAVQITDETRHTYRNEWTLQVLGEGPGRHRAYLFAGGGLGAYSSSDQYPTTRPGYPTEVSAHGFSLAVGLGYDWRIARWLTVQPEAAYHHTWLGALDLNSDRTVPGRDTMNLVALSLGLAYRTP
jgi:hypothetical protein